MGRRGRQLAQKHVDLARRAVISEWDRWASRRLPTGYKATGDDEMRFFGHMQKNCPHLLPDGWMTPGRLCMDGCYWSGGLEINRGQLHQHGDAVLGNILPAHLDIMPSPCFHFCAPNPLV